MNLRALLARRGPFIDLRSPAEFAAGAVPGAVNLPLLTDAERHEVGLAYKRRGQEAAMALGHRLVSGPIREARTRRWIEFCRRHPRTSLYCWRGGQRSAIVQRWLQDEGIEVPRVNGGFKALRHTCLSVLEEAPGCKRWVVIGGRTGTGKTRLLARLPGSIDLEALANHRGSAFGATGTPQPPPIAFENALAVTWLNHTDAVVYLEDESRTIGRLSIPPGWHAAMQEAPLIILEAPLEVRVNNIIDEYVHTPLAEGMAATTLFARLEAAANRIRRRLGGQRHAEVIDYLRRGWATGEHAPWVERLLVWYYDPMYDYQLKKKAHRVLFRGTAADIRARLSACTP